MEFILFFVTIQPVLKKNIVINNFGFVFLEKQLYCKHLFITN